MQNLTNKALYEQEILEKINKIILLRIKSLLIKNLKKEDIPRFEQIVKSNNSNLLLSFASKKIPNLSNLISQEIDNIRNEIYLKGK